MSLPKGPCTLVVYTLALKYSLYRYIGPKVYAIWVHGPLGQYMANRCPWASEKGSLSLISCLSFSFSALNSDCSGFIGRDFGGSAPVFFWVFQVAF